jgi:hypothetical protein
LNWRKGIPRIRRDCCMYSIHLASWWLGDKLQLTACIYIHTYIWYFN